LILGLSGPCLDRHSVADDHRDVAVLHREAAGSECAAINRRTDTLAVAVVEDSLPAALDRLCAAVAGLMGESDVHQFLYRFLTADTPPSCVGVHVGGPGPGAHVDVGEVRPDTPIAVGGGDVPGDLGTV